MDPLAADKASRESDYFFSYRPTDPRLRDSPALAHLQQFILQVGAQAFGSGTSLSLVRSRLSEHQTQFDAFLRTLDGLFQPRDAGLATAMRSDNIGAAHLDVAQEVPQFMPRSRTSPKRPRNAKAYDVAAPDYPEDVFTDTPRYGPDNPDGFGNRTRRVKAVAAQQDLSYEDWREARFSSWLEGLPELPSNIPHKLAQSGHEPQDDTKQRETRHNDHDKHKTSASQVKNNPVYAPSKDYPKSDPLPYYTRSEFDVHPRDEFESWAEQKRHEFRQRLNLKAYRDPQPASP